MYMRATALLNQLLQVTLIITFYRHVVGSVGTTVPGCRSANKGCPRQPRVEQGHEGEYLYPWAWNIMRGYLDNPEETEKAFWENGWVSIG